MKFKVVTAQYLSDNLTTGVTDFMPNAGLPAGVVR
jgi:hypothetical protein